MAIYVPYGYSYTGTHDQGAHVHSLGHTFGRMLPLRGRGGERERGA